MTHGEHLKTIKFAIDKVNKRVPVIAGTGSNCTETAIMMSKEAASYGADALLIVTPYYNKATQKGLINNRDFVNKFFAQKQMSFCDVTVHFVPSNTLRGILPVNSISMITFVKTSNQLPISDIYF